MKHFGDITRIDGKTVPRVEVVIGGSPCQDLSVAGKRAGLAGKRSGLFMEQIRVIKEMREKDEADSRTDTDVFPRFMVWENVPGALSSNRGEDFRAVLEETARVVDKNAAIPRYEGGAWRTAGAVVGDGWSIAWRVHDAQFWGVPQRRRRISLVADFGGQSASEILFEREGVHGDPEPGGKKEEETAAGAGNRAENTDHNAVKAFSQNGSGETTVHEVINAITTNQNPSGRGTAMIFGFQPQAGGRTGCAVMEDISPCLEVSTHSAVYDARGNGDGQIVPTITGDHENRITDYTAVCIGNGQANNTHFYEKAPALSTMHDQQAVLVRAVDTRNFTESKKNGTLTSGKDQGYNLNANIVLRTVCGVRRLTPLECERLQGYPDGWTDIGDWTDSKGKPRKTSDSARYKALGNSIALPFWAWMLRRLNGYCREHTMASLFDGIGGFPLIWERINGAGRCLWASEIEEFPIAVTKLRFGEE